MLVAGQAGDARPQLFVESAQAQHEYEPYFFQQLKVASLSSGSRISALAAAVPAKPVAALLREAAPHMRFPRLLDGEKGVAATYPPARKRRRQPGKQRRPKLRLPELQEKSKLVSLPDEQRPDPRIGEGRPDRRKCNRHRTRKKPHNAYDEMYLNQRLKQHADRVKTPWQLRYKSGFSAGTVSDGGE